MISDPADTRKPAAAYLCRSTDKQEQSLGDQRTEITRWAKENGFVIVKEFLDDAISGTTSKKRPGFQSMIADAGKGEFSAVIVWNSDRFSRADIDETSHYRYLLREAGVTLHSVTEEYVASEDLSGDLMRTFKQFQNRQFSVSLSQNTLRGQCSSVLKASDPGRMPPYGYDRQVLGPDGSVVHTIRFMPGGDRQTFDKDGKPQTRYAKGQSLDKPGRECTARLVLSEDERVQTVRDIFAWCVAGKGLKGIAAELNRRGLMSPKGRLWQHTTIRELVKNPVYHGAIVWNRRTESKFYELRQGRADRLKPSLRSGSVEHVSKEDWVVVENALPAIIDKDTWERAQMAAAARSQVASGKGKQDGRWLLSGVLKCGCCGSSYWGLTKTKGKGHGKKIVSKGYYVCANRCRSGKSVCPYPAHVGAADLEKLVLDELSRTIFRHGEILEDAIERFVGEVTGGSGGGTDIQKHQSEIERIDRQVGALVSGLDPANIALINDTLTTLRRRREFLQEQVRSIQAADARVDEKALRRFATERLTLLSEAMRGRRDEHARAVIASFVDEIVIDPETKSGVMVLGAGLSVGAPDDGGDNGPREPVGEEAHLEFAPPHAATSASTSERAASDPQKPNNRPSGDDRSQVSGIAGVGFESAPAPVAAGGGITLNLTISADTVGAFMRALIGLAGGQLVQHAPPSGVVSHPAAPSVPPGTPG